ncbi:hypothetical protein AHAS_Ahas16G0200100 [Arachis hypogaea]
MAVIANLADRTSVATLQAVQRFGQPAENRNGNGDGDSNDLGGTTNSTEADNWFQVIKRALQAQHVPANQYVDFAAYQLLGEAQHWWQGECQLLQLRNAEIPWDVFQTAFYKKYFLESVRETRELELMQLKQGSMSVAEYTNKFEELCRLGSQGYVRESLSHMRVGNVSSTKEASRITS